MNKILLNQMIAETLVSVQKHPVHELYIYNYTAKAQYDRVWNEVTLACRGLICDAEGNVVARPFKKFFNLGEYEGQHIPASPFEVYEKMDGSLGISYKVDDKFYIATRGSFTSDQALRATDMLHNHYAHALQSMEDRYTYLFEIIYPENRIVLDYGDRKELVLLAIIDNATGHDLPLVDIGFPVVKKYDGIKDIELLKNIQEENKEGFVIKYEDGYRLKLKFDEYVRLHRIITCVSTVSIWEYLKTVQSMDEILDQVPDEFYNWIKAQKQELESQYKMIEEEAKASFKILDTRKETALYFMQCKHPHVMFNMLDGKDYSDTIWRQLRPAHSKPFINKDES
jgi:T4 RnlA family RNA ligase